MFWVLPPHCISWIVIATITAPNIDCYRVAGWGQHPGHGGLGVQGLGLKLGHSPLLYLFLKEVMRGIVQLL